MAEAIITIKPFQSAPPAEARGDNRKINAHEAARLTAGPRRHEDFSFQSAPPAEARGEMWRGSHLPNLVSIRSPGRSKGRFENLRIRPLQVKFTRFNPLPRPKQGEILKSLIGDGSQLSVSIRSPGRSKGRWPT